MSESSSTTASTTSTSTTTASTTTTTTKAQLKWEELEDIRLKLVHEIGDSPGTELFHGFEKVIENLIRLIMVLRYLFWTYFWSLELS